MKNDTPVLIKKKVLKIEHQLYNQAIEKVLANL